jgi:Fe-S cluster assembly protein SufD
VTTPVVSGAVESYVGSFESLNGRASDVPAWVQSMRRAAFDRFAALGFPTTKNEDWHFTSVAAIADKEFTLLASPSGDVQKEELEQFGFGAENWVTMVFVNGRYDASLSDCSKLPKGVKLHDLASAWTKAPELVDRVGKVASYDNAAFTALNAAFMHDGAVLEIAKDVEVDRPIHLLFVTDANAAKGMMHPRNIIIAGRNSKATVIESYVSLSDAMHLTNAVTEVSVGERRGRPRDSEPRRTCDAGDRLRQR